MRKSQAKSEPTKRKGIKNFFCRGTVRRKGKNIGRNAPCPCGKLQENGKPMKFKNCCKPKIKHGVA